MHYWDPTTIYKNDQCNGYATVVPAYENSTFWNQGTLNGRKMQNEAESVMVPPGWKLEMWSKKDH